LKINVDQFALDTKSRKLKWSYYRKHPFHYLINRVQWNLYPSLKYKPDFPIHIDFEISSLCNLKCPMCYRPFRASADDGLMDFAVYKKGIDECVKFGLYSIRLSWRGEPTLHPRLPEMVSYAKQGGIKEVSFISNGVKLRGNFARELVLAGLDYFSVSIDGINETYEKIRYPSKFPEIVDALKEIRQYRDELGNGFPRIRINSIWSAIKDCKEEYYAVFSPIVDYITINPDYDHSVTESNIDPNHICQYLYQRMSILWNGTIPLCICDKSAEIVLGNLETDSIYNMWHGPDIENVRKMQTRGKTDEIKPCSKCQRSLTTQIGDQKPF